MKIPLGIIQIITKPVNYALVLRTEYLLSWCSVLPLIWYATWLLSKKKCFDLLTPPQGVKGVSAGKIFATMLQYVSFPLIWYSTWPYSEKKIILASATPPSLPRGLDLGLQTKIPSDMFVCLILYVPSTIFQLNRNGSSWVEPVLMLDVSCSRTTTQWRRWGSNPRSLGLESSTLPLSPCAPPSDMSHINCLHTKFW